MRSYPLTSEALIDDVVVGLDGVAETVRRVFGHLPSGLLAWQPSPKWWSAGHCLLHLARTGEAYRETLAPALDRARTGGVLASASLHGTLLGRLFTGWMAPGRGLKAKTPDVFRPDPGLSPGDAVDLFLAEQARVRALALAARGVDLDAARIRSPASAILRFTAGDALRILVQHEWRHLHQAEAVLLHPEFPG
jgi:hypothetical protein